MRRYRIAGDIYIVDPTRARLYRYAGKTTNARVIALHDAVDYNGQLDTVHVDHDGWIAVQHHVAGVEHRFYPGEWLDEPVRVFDEPDKLPESFVIGGDA